jgi:hypothetical protein
MKSLYILFLICLFSANLLAQFSEFGDGPRWYILNHQEDSIEEFFFTKDTVFCGKKYSVLNNSKYQNEYDLHGYVRVDNEKVFFRYTNSCNDKEYLLYDFSLNTGDTVYCGYNLIYSNNPPTQYSDTTKFWVTNIDTINMLGKARKRLSLKFAIDPIFSSMSADMKWIEGIGSVVHPFYAFYDWNDKSTWFDLACLDSSGVLIYKITDISINCDSITGISTEINYQFQDKIKVFPNPTENQLAIVLPNDFGNKCHIELINLQGQVISDFGTYKNKRINLTLPNLQAGQYIVAIRQGNEYITKKIMIDQ